MIVDPSVTRPPINSSFWHEVLGHIPEGITVISHNGDLLYANEWGARACGFDSASEMLEAGLSEIWERNELIDEFGKTILRDQLPGRHVLSGAEPSEETIVRFRNKLTGHEHWSELRVSALHTSTHPHPVLVNIFRDVTERIERQRNVFFLSRASELLAQSLDYDAALHTLASLAVPAVADWCTIDVVRDDGTVENVAVAHTDPDKVRWARALQTRYPFNPNAQRGVAKVLRTGESEFNPAITPAMIESSVRDAELVRILNELRISASLCVPLIHLGQVYGAMTLVREQDRHFRDHDVIMAEDLGRRAGVTLANAGLYRRAERAYAEQQAVLSQIIDGIIVIDGRGTVIYANDAAHDIYFGVAVGEPVERARPNVKVTEFGRAEDAYDPALKAALAGTTVSRMLCRVQCPNHVVRIVQTSATPLRDAAGTFLGAVAVARDVTAEREFEEQKINFFLGASHDLKTPLTVVKGTAQLLERRAITGGPINDSFIAGLRQISTTASRMAEAVNDMLAETSAQLGDPRELRPTRMDLQHLLQEVVRAALASGERDGLQVQATTEPLEIDIDRARLERVINNLLANALKFSDPASEIIVRCGRDGKHVWFSVTDHGIGIPPAELDAIFEQFRRGTNVAGTVTGSGIGLSVAKQIVELHGGSIEVISEVGKGSTFMVRLPAAAELTDEPGQESTTE